MRQKSKKGKSNNGGGSDVLQKHPAVTCILHICGIQHGDFTPFSNVKWSATDKLGQTIQNS